MHFLNSVFAAAVAVTSVVDASAIKNRAAKQLQQVTAFNAGPTAAKMVRDQEEFWFLAVI